MILTILAETRPNRQFTLLASSKTAFVYRRPLLSATVWSELYLHLPGNRRRKTHDQRSNPTSNTPVHRRYVLVRRPDLGTGVLLDYIRQQDISHLSWA